MAFPTWTRREWLAHTGVTSAAVVVGRPAARGWRVPRVDPELAAQAADEAQPLDMTLPRALVQHAIDAARAAGASYADARITRTVQHRYGFQDGFFDEDRELLGFGVRALVNGYWGFAASPVWTTDEAARLATAAVAQARVNAQGTQRTVDLGARQTVTGSWTTPVKIDPFTIPIEEKIDHIQYWIDTAPRDNVHVYMLPSYLRFARQERVTATTDGTLVTQTTFESAGVIATVEAGNVPGLDVSAQGWELFLNANIPAQFAPMQVAHNARRALQRTAQPATVGRYTIVCDGATMARVVDQTLGFATQLDRALGFEANAGGTSYLRDPLAMLGSYHVSSPDVTVTTNRSAPGELATIKWDDEGVEPTKHTLVTKGVLTDFQTTREQAAWLAPYYQRAGRPVRSSGCAGAESALSITMQHTPNLALEPVAGSVTIDDLIANVANGILVTDGGALDNDFQLRRGLIAGEFRKIKNGRLGGALQGGAVLYDTPDFWRKVAAVGGASTRATVGFSQYPYGGTDVKGQPSQSVSHSVSAVAAVIEGQAVIDPHRR